MAEILHTVFPEDMRTPRALPGIRPVTGPWLRVDEAYGGQMAHRAALLAEHGADVLRAPDHAMAAGRELLEMVLEALPGLGFMADGAGVLCPDGRRVVPDRARPLESLNQLVQCDFCLLDRPEGAAEHVLEAAILCFPANWRLSEKIGRPLVRIHAPVPEYEPDIARRVQRLFDGVQAGRPIWRFNQLRYGDPELYQPLSAFGPRRHKPRLQPFVRMERQTILRLPRTGWVVFAIHTYVLRGSEGEAGAG